ncbi:unnamed protein product [Phytomonas sp. EM1]|nr:unnamed protein product [Phytomonas sp. EM1]|eukprot:CCW64726.1 unnamed protein product [Phytomonas sp. isolate EM1]
MFGRRVFASAPIPRHLYARLHIQTSSQAARRMPSLAPLSSLEGKNSNVLNSLAIASARDGAVGANSSPSLAKMEELFAVWAPLGSTAALAFLQLNGKGLTSWCMPLTNLRFRFHETSLSGGEMMHSF